MVSSLDGLKTAARSSNGGLRYAARVERTLELEPDYLVLIRDRDTSAQKYQDIRSRLLEAKVSGGLGTAQR